MFGANHPTGRRAILKSAGATTATLFGVGTVSGSGDTVEIVTERTKRGPVTKQVPRAWYEYEQAVDRALERAEQQYSDQSGLKSIHLVPSSQSRGGMRVSQIEFAVRFNSRTADVPDAIEGIPVNTTTVRRDIPTSCRSFDGAVDQIDGGRQVSGDNGVGTAACRVFYDGKTCLLTANHLFDSCESNNGDGADQGGEDIGNIIGYDAAYDWAVIEDTTSKTFTDYIENPENYSQLPSGDLEVAGYFTYNGTKYLMDNALPIWKQGITTNQQIGHIYRMNYSTSFGCVNFSDGIYSSCDTADGDSGGPTYAETSDQYGDVSMIGVNVASNKLDRTDNTMCGNYVHDAAIATPAHQLVDFGIDFEESHCC